MKEKRMLVIHAVLNKFSKHLLLIIILAIAFKGKIAPNVPENLLIAGVVFAAILHMISKLIQKKIHLDKF